MKLPWFKNQPVDESFFDNAPVVLAETFAVNRPAAEVWAELTALHPLSWCRIIGNGISWTSNPPYGVGTTRTVSALKGANKFREHFFIWEEGRRQAFYVLEASAPLAKRFAEDYVVEPVSDTSCNFTWTIAYEPTAIGKAGDAINQRLLKSLFADTRKHYGG
ncbi:MAG: SRPBCC family protein [Solirubrobacterales bacterium]